VIAGASVVALRWLGATPRSQPQPHVARITPAWTVKMDREPRERITATHKNVGCGLTVVHGRNEDADAYYDVIAGPAHLGIAVHPGSRQNISTVQALLDYLGHSELRPGRLETDPSDQIESSTAGAAVAVSFFAPKTSDVAMQGPAHKYNWRRIVRVKSAPQSPADQQHVDGAFLLFNVVTSAPSTGPTRPTLFVQAMLLPRGDRPGMFEGYW